MEFGHLIEAPARRASVSAMPATPRLSRRAGLWAVAFAFLVVAAFSTAPSPLYGLFAHQEHLSSLTITFAYAVYAVGVVVSLVLAGHVSDWYGRRAVLLPAIAVAVVAAVLFLLWNSLAGLLAARVLTGVALGATVATATAYITDLDAGPGGAATRRAGIVATVANIGGLACGPLIAGLLARNAAHALTLPFQVFLAALVLAGIAVVLAPEGHPPVHPRPRYRPQRLSVPPQARRPFTAAAAGVGLCFAVLGLYAGLAGMFLAGPLHHPGPRWPPDDLPELRRRRRRPDDDDRLGAAAPDRGRNRGCPDRAGRAGGIGLDRAAEPGPVRDRRHRGRRRQRRDLPRQPDDGHPHLRPR